MMLQERLSAEIVRSRRDKRNFALHLLDLDGSKPINDMLGHTAETDFLIETAERLVQVVGNSGMAARIGGDEFAVLQTGSKMTRSAPDLALRIRRGVVRHRASYSKAHRIGR